MDPIVKDVMTTQVVAVHAHASFPTMAATLRAYRISAFPVLDEARKMIGVVCEADLLAKEALESEPGGLGALRDLLLRVSQLAEDQPEVTELVLSPVMGRSDSAFVLNARIKVTPGPPQDPFLRKLR
jgi:CBS-domain-containing membrane protein